MIPMKERIKLASIVLRLLRTVSFDRLVSVQEPESVLCFYLFGNTTQVNCSSNGEKK